MTAKIRRIRVFLDGTTWETEVGRDPDGTEVYPSLKAALNRHEDVAGECGVAECELRFVRWVMKPKAIRR